MATGGELMLTDAAEQLKGIFRRVLRDMQSRYTLAYYPRTVRRPGWHTIESRVRNKQADSIRARSGYFIPPD